ncbi:MAG: hypothetical protein ABWZ40_12715 [Caulobacterales bacterium]
MRSRLVYRFGLSALLLSGVVSACSQKPAEPAAEAEAAASAAPSAATGAPATPADAAVSATPGASLAAAAPLALGASVTADMLNTEAHHFYKMENALKARDRVQLRFENLSSTLKPDVKIYDANRSLISERYDGTAGASLDYTFTLEPSQTIYIEVLPYNSSGQYRMSLTAQNAFDKFEPNADALSAAAVKTGDDIEGNILDEKDEDWYRVSGASADKLTVTLENQSVTLKPDIKIYNSNKSELLEKYDGTPGANLSFEAPAEAGKDIYVQVLPYNSSGKYKLSVK